MDDARSILIELLKDIHSELVWGNEGAAEQKIDYLIRQLEEDDTDVHQGA